MPREITLKKYKDMLDKHDWFWFNSDSTQVRDLWYTAEQKLEKLAATYKTYQNAFDRKKESIFNNNSKI